jgi:DNA-binding transcriptional regulator YiaG
MLQPSLVTPAQYRRHLAAAEARADRLRAELVATLKEAEFFRQMLSLHSDGKHSNIGSNMEEQTEATTRRARISAGRATIDSKSRKDAAKADLSDILIARLVGASRQAVQKWHTGKLAIPKRHADKLAKPRMVEGKEKPGIPVESWPRLGD